MSSGAAPAYTEPSARESPPNGSRSSSAVRVQGWSSRRRLERTLLEQLPTLSRAFGYATVSVNDTVWLTYAFPPTVPLKYPFR